MGKNNNKKSKKKIKKRWISNGRSRFRATVGCETEREGFSAEEGRNREGKGGKGRGGLII